MCVYMSAKFCFYWFRDVTDTELFGSFAQNALYSAYTVSLVSVYNHLFRLTSEAINTQTLHCANTDELGGTSSWFEAICLPFELKHI